MARLPRTLDELKELARVLVDENDNIRGGATNPIQVAGTLTANTEAAKIDEQAVDGLTGTPNSLAYKVAEIERHFHSGARWFEAAGTPDGEDHVADRIGTVGGGGAFEIDSGNQTWGSWVQILGSDDTPTVEGKAYFDPHLLAVEDSERAGTYFVQFARGASGAAGYAAGNYTEVVLTLTNKPDNIVPVQTGRAPAGSKLWARCMTPAFDTGTLEFYIGIHEYEG